MAGMVAKTRFDDKNSWKLTSCNNRNIASANGRKKAITYATLHHASVKLMKSDTMLHSFMQLLKNRSPVKDLLRLPRQLLFSLSTRTNLQPQFSVHGSFSKRSNTINIDQNRPKRTKQSKMIKNDQKLSVGLLSTAGECP